MEQQQLMDVIQNIATGLGKLMGNDTEIVVHDIPKRQIEYIVNGNITNRTAGAKMPESVYEMILSQVDDDDHMIAYPSTSSNGLKLRSSHFIIRDEQGNPVAMICINQDTSKLEAFKNYLDNMVRLHDGVESKTSDNIIQSFTQKAIMNSIWNVTSSDLDTKEGKIELLKNLKRQGIFDVKATTPYICKALSISQTTLYNYLREIKDEEVGQLNLRAEEL